MRFDKLLHGYSGNLGKIDIKGITCNSGKVEKDFVFVCISGTKKDGHMFADDAVKSGAAVIVCERDLGLKNQVIVENSRAAYSTMSANWFSNPAKHLKLIGVTGTNGKTSVTYMMKAALEKAGHKVGLIGTIQNMVGDRVIESKNTTPDAYELNYLFDVMRKEGCTYVVMEVSSHALDQCRVYNLEFEIAIFTNLTQDHLDYHITMDNYLEAKKRLFRMCKTAVINSDDSYSQKLCEGLDCRIVTYSMSNESTYSAKGVNYRPASVDYELVGDSVFKHVSVKTGGKFTVYNSSAVLVTAIELGLDLDIVTLAISELKGVKGRAEVVPNDKDFTVIIDYAHTPDGLKNILSTFKECNKNRLIVLFGCGGDRDRTKRAIMGTIAVRKSDFVIVTSDNPRTEDPKAIINDILEGTQGAPVPVTVIENRIEAIKYAISIAKKDDIIVLAGKGHETYQILKDETIHLDEREIVKEALEELE